MPPKPSCWQEPYGTAETGAAHVLPVGARAVSAADASRVVVAPLKPGRGDFD